MDIHQSYQQWSEQYDTNENKTRDLEAIALKEMLGNMHFENCLEIGCGTGKNTEFLIGRCTNIIALDLTAEMLNIAKTKIQNKNVSFVHADIMENWNFVSHPFDLVVCSLVLEHIEKLNPIFRKISDNLRTGGCLYIGELHPFKQYMGSKAKFSSEEGEQVVTCFTHHISAFVSAAEQAGLKVETIKEYFDEGDKTNPPRILAMTFRK